MGGKSVEEIEAEITDLKARWPAHSVPPRMWQELEKLEEQLEQAERDRGNGELNADRHK